MAVNVDTKYLEGGDPGVFVGVIVGVFLVKCLGVVLSHSLSSGCIFETLLKHWVYFCHMS
jgi:hypothetical protein